MTQEEVMYSWRVRLVRCKLVIKRFAVMEILAFGTRILCRLSRGIQLATSGMLDRVIGCISSEFPDHIRYVVTVHAPPAA